MFEVGEEFNVRREELVEALNGMFVDALVKAKALDEYHPGSFFGSYVQESACRRWDDPLQLDYILMPNTPNTCLLYTSPSPRD